MQSTTFFVVCGILYGLSNVYMYNEYMYVLHFLVRSRKSHFVAPKCDRRRSPVKRATIVALQYRVSYIVDLCAYPNICFLREMLLRYISHILKRKHIYDDFLVFIAIVVVVIAVVVVLCFMGFSYR